MCDSVDSLAESQTIKAGEVLACLFSFDLLVVSIVFHDGLSMKNCSRKANDYDGNHQQWGRRIFLK